MSIIETIPETAATGEVADIYESARQASGYIPSHVRITALNPPAHRAWEALTGAIGQSMGLRAYELVTLAAADAIGSEACRLAHGKKALGCFDEEQLLRIATDYRDAGLTDAEVAMMDFAVKLSGDSASMTDADAALLRAAGLTDPQIVDIALAAGARNFYSRVLHALAVEVDVPPGLSPALQAALRS